MGFWDTFNDFRRPTRVLLVASLLLGIAVLAAGLMVDGCTEWLNGLNYIPNIWAGFTGFLIGAPVALTVLATFTGEREEKYASDRVQALSRIAWNEFSDAILDLCGDHRISALKQGAQRIQEFHDQSRVPFQREIFLSDDDEGHFLSYDPQHLESAQGQIRM